MVFPPRGHRGEYHFDFSLDGNLEPVAQTRCPITSKGVLSGEKRPPLPLCQRSTDYSVRGIR